MRLLGVDLGKARIGVAVAEAEFGVISSRPALAAVGALAKDADTVAAAAKREMVDRIVLGVPEHEDGRMAKVCRTFADLLIERGWAVDLVDETLSSSQADDRMFEAGLKASQRRKRLDGEAAGMILERYLSGGKLGG